MPVLVTADIHLSDNPRDAYRHRFMDKLATLIDRHIVDAIVVLGDLTEEKDRHSASLTNQVVSHLVKWAELCNVVLLRGNHDALDPSVPFFKFSEHIEGITWVNVPTDNIGAWPSQLGKALFLPYTSNYKRDWATFDFTEYNWIFCHNMFTGAAIGNGRTGEGIPIDVFKGTRATVIAGDVHIPQQVGDSRIHYVGAPYTVDFGDSYKPRVFVLSPNEYRSIPVSGPQKRLVEITSVGDLESREVLRHLSEGDILKVRVSIAPSDHAKWSEIQQAVRKWAAGHEFVINAVQPNIVHSERPSARRKLRSATSDEELIDGYAKLRAIDAVTVKVGKRLMEEE